MTTTLPSLAKVLDGKALADAYRAAIAQRVKAVEARGGRVRLDAILVGTADNAARVYATNQGKTCNAVGIGYKLHELGSEAEVATYDDIAGRVLLLNTQEHVHAVMLHMPLPDGIDPYSVQKLIAPEKDVEGVNPANIGNVVYGRSSLAPCTGLAVVKMLAATGVPLRGKKCLVIGASDVVGKPIAVLLMRTDATVISCNKYTGQDAVAALAREADVIVAAAGVPGLVTANMVKPGAIVVDVGVNRVAGPDGKMRTVGDADFSPVAQALGPNGWISPVPGGVGPMTVTMLLLNVVRAAERAVGIISED
ncbi:MAG: bifunctional 5,10-methylenetetrahydrofolate dehydrogenase/5,10-methenyltetrahydrofolate cyclohydrolase [Phycisphaerales bacterium]|jgi:methylenetetrahydrofolate dehydrogenase (NADP+)/methenyltetrahydrofolate cyclohydrolase|nr:bifunctional 5,10-methylenetetrahydrofolate dehydrogenase/5,10-methenyltetrahydrofolate cyclohydrolase [Phycisphaerales bacterium]